MIVNPTGTKWTISLHFLFMENQSCEILPMGMQLFLIFATSFFAGKKVERFRMLFKFYPWKKVKRFRMLLNFELEKSGNISPFSICYLLERGMIFSMLCSNLLDENGPTPPIVVFSIYKFTE